MLGHECSARMGPGTWGRGKRRERRKINQNQVCVERLQRNLLLWRETERQRDKEGRRRQERAASGDSKKPQEGSMKVEKTALGEQPYIPLPSAKTRL